MFFDKPIKYEFDLTCKYDSRLNFYGKAKVLECYDGTLYLKSYDTVVSECNDGVVKNYGYYSATTSRHQKEFYKQFDTTGRDYKKVKEA